MLAKAESRASSGIVVQKFGGSSVADAARMRACVERVREAQFRGERPVVVVSAMGDSTDDLLAMMSKFAASPARREVDQLLATGEQVSIALMAMVLTQSGVPAVSLTGQQAGIECDGRFGRARITRVRTDRLEHEVRAGRVPVVAGFQAVTPDGDIATLGRGGSDTTAVAIASALGARECEIFTDVEGVFTGDPRLVTDARLLPRVALEDMIHAAMHGAQVMHLRAVEFAREHTGLPIRVLHSRGNGRGTLITAQPGTADEATRPSFIIAARARVVRVTCETDGQRVLASLRAAGIEPRDVVVDERGGSVHLSLEPDEHAEAEPLLSAGAFAVRTLAKVAIVGPETLREPAARTCRSYLASEGIEAAECVAGPGCTVLYVAPESVNTAALSAHRAACACADELAHAATSPAQPVPAEGTGLFAR